MARHPGWELVNIYADEGISGISLRNRNAFNAMINDCKFGKINLIVTKSISRFSRNIVDCIRCVDELKALKPPVGVFFESEQIYTLNPDNRLPFTLLATLAENESCIKSTAMNASIEMRFSNGIFLTPPLLGYDNDEDGNLIINKNEANTVRLIFYMYLSGLNTGEISEKLTALDRQTKIGNKKWSPGSVLGTLKNERYYGAVLARKTWTPNVLDHKSVKNRGDHRQYLKTNHHEPIISRDDFIAVQKMIANAKYGNNRFLPKLRVNSDGALSGFVSVNPRWSAFTADDYRDASMSVTRKDNK